MSCCTRTSKAYKFLVLAAVCFTQMLRSGIIVGSLSLFTVYYIQNYDDKALASNIGSTQLSVVNLAAFPALLLNKKIGERWMQIIGGALTVGGMVATAFTTQAWQAMLCNSIATGLGAAFMSVATYSILSKYFTGSQLAPYAAITVCQNIGVMAAPQVIKIAMETIGFKYTFIVCAAALATTIAFGFLFLPVEVNEDKMTQRKNSVKDRNVISLKFNGKKQGIYRLPSVPDYESTNETVGTYQQYDLAGASMKRVGSSATLQAFGIDSPVVTKKEQLDRVALSNMLYEYQRTVSAKIVSSADDELKGYGDSDSTDSESFSDSISTVSTDIEIDLDNADTESNKTPSIYELVSKNYGESIANLLDNSATAKKSLRKVFTNKAALNFLLAAFITVGGFVAFNINVGEYSMKSLHFSSEQFVLGLTIQAIAQLITGVFYLVATRFLRFSVSFVYVISIVGSAGVTFSLLCKPTIDTFYIVMAVSGFFKSVYVGAAFGCGMEVTSPSVAVVMFMVLTFVEGIGGIVFSYSSSYLQTQVNLSAGMIAAGGAQLLGGISLLPLSINYLMTPKDYNRARKVQEKVQQTGYQSACAKTF